MARFVVNPAQVLDVVDLKPTQPAEGLSLSRWSRLKRSGGEAAVTPVSEVVAAPEAAIDASTPLSAAEAANAAELNLPQLSSISLAEDFTPFMQAKVPQALKRQALKALFKEPHFNVMDGLDTYIDDYTVFEPITPEVMATLSSWKTITKPQAQVVTPGGYAVDVESEEGKAVLAASMDSDALAQGPTASDDSAPHGPLSQGEMGSPLLDPESDPGSAASPLSGDARHISHLGAAGDAVGAELNPAMEVSDAIVSIQHPRYNKRVSDFAYIDAPEVPPPGAEKAE
jgi:hypothetical protein